MLRKRGHPDVHTHYMAGFKDNLGKPVTACQTKLVQLLQEVTG